MNRHQLLSCAALVAFGSATTILAGCTSDDSSLANPSNDSGADALSLEDASPMTEDAGPVPTDTGPMPEDAGPFPPDASAPECSSADDCTGTPPACGTPTCEDGLCGFAPVSSGRICRDLAGECDVVERCDGVSTECPADVVVPADIYCRARSGACDTDDFCNGREAECPDDAVVSAGVLCRASAGACDIAEACDGSSKECPADAVAPADTECRASAGVCDTAETCNGVRTECPRDGFAPDTLVCRAPVHRCDATESCPGTAALCPADSPATGCAPADGSTPIRYSALGRNLTINSVQINTVAQTAITVRAGTSVTVSIDGLWTNAGTSCPGCITQFYLRVSGEANVCLGSVTGGTRFSRKFITFTPMVPGTYYANLTQGWDFSCSDSTRVSANYSSRGTVAIINVE